MGTRGNYGFICHGDKKVTYNHFDSYPEGLGIAIKNAIDRHSTEQMVEAFDRIVMVYEDGKPSKEQRKELQNLGITPQRVSTGDDWYAWLRDCQNGLEAWLDNNVPYMMQADGIDWIRYTYVLDLDNEQLLFSDYTGRQFALPFDEVRSLSDEAFTEKLYCLLQQKIDMSA